MQKGVFCSPLKMKTYEIQGTEAHGFPGVFRLNQYCVPAPSLLKQCSS